VVTAHGIPGKTTGDSAAQKEKVNPFTANLKLATMTQSGISCISPIDGRYAATTAPLQHFFSEEALFRYRVLVEAEYFIALCTLPLPELKKVPKPAFEKIRETYTQFSTADAIRIKEIEKTTNHDIKAVEYFMKEQLQVIGLSEYNEYIHFGLTSQDINNTAIPLSLKEGLHQVIFPALIQLLEKLEHLSAEWMMVPMLAHTHGQPASPTTVGKELLVFHERLRIQSEELMAMTYPAKFGGATGNFNAHHIAYPEINWILFADRFVQSLGLQRSRHTTQIDHYDRLAALFDALKRMCSIIIDLDRDCWSYISMNYFSQKTVEGEVGSSAMPHKVNPIDFENAEGNAGIAIALFEHLSAKLPISRLQRDLTDSTVLRNLGVPLAHMLIAIQSSIRGLNKISLNERAIEQDLDNNLAVVAEALQTILRKLNYPQPYEQLKKLTRNKHITRDILNDFIDQLDIPSGEKERMKQITPSNYTGIIPKTNK
jgi:adenylosuccinate lyase